MAARITTPSVSVITRLYVSSVPESSAALGSVTVTENGVATEGNAAGPAACRVSTINFHRMLLNYQVCVCVRARARVVRTAGSS